MKFTREYFDPQSHEKRGSEGSTRYVYTDEIILAVNVAFATRRPLLVTGPPGSGKSTLARSIAEAKGYRYLSEVVTSRAQASDLMARFDTVRRLNAATSGGQVLPDAAYVEPGVLWWTFDPESARRRGADLTNWSEAERQRFVPAARNGVAEELQGDAVLLLDEIDKAEPDVPNDLLEPLDVSGFRAKPTGFPVELKHTVFIVLTTNGERELPPAFIRRCIVLKLKEPDKSWLLEVARRHFGEEFAQHHGPLADQLIALQKVAARKGIRPPSTAEYLNAIRACGELGVNPDTIAEVLQLAMWKHEEDVEGLLAP